MITEQRRIVAEDCAQALDKGHEALRELHGAVLLATGGTGFLGAWLAEMITRLNDSYGFGCKLYLLSSRASAFAERLPYLAARKEITLIERDVRSVIELPSDITHIIHAAASPDSRLHVSDPLRTIQVIVQGATAVLEAAVRLPELQRILHISSGQVYGHQPYELPNLPEEFWGALDPNAIGAAYPEAKRCAETICAAYRHGYRMHIAIARPFAYIGPHQPLDKPWAVNNFLRDGLLGGPIRILGAPETVRSYLYASDMAFWMLRMLASSKTSQCFNIGSPEGVTLHDLARRIAAQCGGQVEVQLPVLPAEAPPPTRFVPDTSLAKKTLGLEATVGLDDAITRTLRWHRSAAPC